MNHSFRLRHLGILAASLVAFVLAAPADAAPAKKPAQAETQGTTGAMQVATSGDWSVFTAGAGKTKVCYALARPKDRQPANLNRDPGYMFVSFRPAEKISGEIAIVVGFPTKEDVSGELSIGTAKYGLLSKGPNVWLKTTGEEPGLIALMEKSAGPMLVAVQSARGNLSTDRYSLTGFTSALTRAKRECR